jgi:hypothetical protein
MPGMLSQLPGILPLHQRRQPQHIRLSRQPGTRPGKPRRHPREQLTQRLPGNIDNSTHPDDTSRRAIINGPHNPP